MEWIDGDHSTSRVLWLSGPVGVGKSTIAQTIAERYSANNSLAASFFFPYAGTGRYWFGSIFPTLAVQMASTIPGFKDHFDEILQSNTYFSPAEGEIDSQAQTLVYKPLRSLQLSTPMVVVIDDLDQCEAHSDNTPADRRYLQCLLVRSLVDALDIQSRICILITSRTEPHLVDVFDGDFCHNIRLEHASDKDLALVLRAGLRAMKPRQTALDPWPDDKTMGTLVWRCSGQYTYAAALLRFIEYHPQQRLQLILGVMAGSQSGPFQKLDTLYLQILHTVTIEDRPNFLQALGAIILLRKPPNAFFIQQYTSWEPFTALSGLHSVFHIPAGPDSDASPVRVRHGSFVEFLLDGSRSEGFFIDAKAHHAKLACYFLELIHRSTTQRSTIHEDLLHYAVKNWCYHCTRSAADEILLKALCDFNLSNWLTLDVEAGRPSVDGLASVVKWMNSKCTTEDTRVLDKKISKIYDRALKEILGQCPTDDTSARLLSLLVVAPRPLTMTELEEILGVNPERLEELIAWLSPRLLRLDGDRYSIEFGSVIEFLTDRKRAGRKFTVDVAAECDQLTTRCLEVLIKGNMSSFFFFALENWTYFLAKSKPSKQIQEFLYKLPTENASSRFDVQRVVQWLQENVTRKNTDLLQKWQQELDIDR